ncbi:LacI family DNA-binding transcriptional regulator [Alkalimonas collagenimarina]|uniref:LacI family DNA-binding transcriptional regulator n=1 Tax=Alkalimonas collagenimarina TaxID=400390 RepID=A0ABT9GYQ4_9GAMM|nr:LacI family DNA-binding transcriptional regulator [Alkalimonas collagenimarina]MDP4536194.1 LacI family DNA-binding transcriptional regulator [Alkalimonas collagenimarina]
MATIYEVSKLAGVSLATVSRVMNNNTPVREATRLKVLAAMEELGYRPNSIAQSLASNRSNSIGILVSELYGPFYGAMISSIEAEFRAAGKHVIIAAGHSEESTEQDGIEFLINRSCDALILHVEAVSDDYLIKLSQSDTPIVLINRQIPAIQSQCISLNNKLGGYLASRLLLEKGHRQLAYISGPLWKTDAKERYRGHQLALQEYGLQPDERLFFEGDFHESGGSDGVAQFLQQGLHFTGLICGNDEMASGAMTEARECGLDIPGDLSIVGYDNVMLSHYTYPKLSTIDYPIAAMGQMAARWVLKHIYQQDKLDVQLVFEPKVIERDSCISLAPTLG